MITLDINNQSSIHNFLNYSIFLVRHGGISYDHGTITTQNSDVRNDDVASLPLFVWKAQSMGKSGP